MKFYTSVDRKGTKILCRGISESGDDQYESGVFSPSLYVRCNKESATHSDFYGGPVQEKTFRDAKEMSDYIKSYGDIPSELWGNKNIVPQYIYETFGQTIEYDKTKVRGAIIDIEVLTRQKIGGNWVDGGFPVASKAEFPVNAICQYDTLTQKYHVHTLADWTPEKSCFPELAEKTIYRKYDTEEQLLECWLSEFRNNYPHYISGWNIENFDIPYLINRIRIVLGKQKALKLSPWSIIDSKTVTNMYGEETIYTIFGVPTLDYIALYKKHTFKPRESYSLDFIAEAELGEHKKEFEGTHGSFFWDDPQGFIDYNIKDVNLVVGLDHKLLLIDLVMSLSYFSGINYVETFSPIRTWDTLIYRECMNRKIAIPLSDTVSKREEYEGAYVFPTKNGMYKSIASFDVASMYPNCNRSWNIGADTIVTEAKYQKIIADIIKACSENDNTELAELGIRKVPFIEYYKNNGMPGYVTDILKENNVCLTPNWQLFRTDVESIFTKLQSDLYFGRKADKKKAQEYAQKEKALHQELLKRGLMKE